MDEKTDKIVEFLKEIDKLKSVERVLRLKYSNNRNENVAEHSWHLAMYVMLFRNEFENDLDYSKMLEFALIHDLVEIYAGDTYIFDKEKLKDKKEREDKAAKKLYSQLPLDLKKRFENLYNEYENQKSEESKIVYSFDKLQPMIQNLLIDGLTWQENKLTFEMLDNNKRPKMKDKKILRIYESVMNEANEKNLFYKEK